MKKLKRKKLGELSCEILGLNNNFELLIKLTGLHKTNIKLRPPIESRLKGVNGKAFFDLTPYLSSISYSTRFAGEALKNPTKIFKLNAIPIT